MKKEEAIRELLTKGVEGIVNNESLVKKLKAGKKLRIKYGIDPTGSKIHIGRAIPIRKLKAFQCLGHQIVLIIGDATALIGDPSDKLDKRPMLTQDQVKKNMKDYKKQLGKILDLKKVEFYNNSTWLKKLNFMETAELAESFSMQQMAARRNFKERIEKEEEISLREMLYPIMQGYDSVMVKADLEIGGTDQLFNLHAGRTIQKHFGQNPQDIMTMQMLEGTDGRKMSTSWGNVITIVDEPKDMFGKIMSIKDELVLKYFYLCTDLPQKEIDKIENNLNKGANPRDIKIRLAKEIVTLYHSKKEAEKAEENFIKQFSKKELPDDIKEIKVRKGQTAVVDLILDLGFAPSKSEARRLIDQGALKIDGAIIGDREAVVTPINGLIIQVGKRRIAKLKV